MLYIAKICMRHPGDNGGDLVTTFISENSKKVTEAAREYVKARLVNYRETAHRLPPTRLRPFFRVTIEHAEFAADTCVHVVRAGASIYDYGYNDFFTDDGVPV